MIKLFGIANCDSCRKAKKWLNENGIDFIFSDFKEIQLEKGLVENWLEKFGKKQLVNKRGTTYKQLSDPEKEIINSENEQINQLVQVIIDKPLLIKRPIIETNNLSIIGFNIQQYELITKSTNND